MQIYVTNLFRVKKNHLNYYILDQKNIFLDLLKRINIGINCLGIFFL